MNPAMHGKAQLAYKAHIDGLRAIAVAVVILYHAHVPGFAGGYVGVDIFFVISGYLITLMLIEPGRDSNRLTFGEFYLRRARRILPAALLTLSVVGGAAFILLLPEDLVRFGRYLAASAVGLTNMTAWADQGYFMSYWPKVPVLHYWSLAVEEQFYLVYPAALLVIGRIMPGRRRAVLLAFGAASLALCLWASHYRPVGGFYLAPTRGWEFILGAILAMSGHQWVRRRVIAEVLALASLLAIALATCLFGSDANYPGITALAPTVATVVLLAAVNAPGSRTGRMLSQPLLAQIGRTSYALYLWHLPVLTLFAYYNVAAPTALQICFLIAFTFLLSIASRLLVEEPIRSRALLTSTRSFLVVVSIAGVIVLAAGVTLWRSDGFPGRLAPDVIALAAGDGIYDEGDRICTPLLDKRGSVGKLCKYNRAAGTGPIALVWGDSHAMMLVPIYERLARSRNMQLYVAAHAACRPLLGVVSAVENPGRRTECARFNAVVAREITELNPALVLLNAHWIDTDADLSPEPAAPLAPTLSGALENTFKRIVSADRSLCVVLDVPTFPYRLPYALAMIRRRGTSTDPVRIARTDALAQFRSVEAELRTLEGVYGFKIVDPKDLLCQKTFCAFESGGAALYGDADHLSLAGAKFVADAVSPCFIGPPHTRPGIVIGGAVGS
jgi:peptidoglycan/LPS O-acetylase OafA/YrhL